MTGRSPGVGFAVSWAQP